jgi:hypothetical protein
MNPTHRETCDPTTDADRLREIAAVLAAGILRLRCRAALHSQKVAAPYAENLPENSLNDLELSRETRLSVHPG